MSKAEIETTDKSTGMFPLLSTYPWWNRPNSKLRVLVMGRAKAGKTLDILQRVCDTYTESPEINGVSIGLRRRRNRVNSHSSQHRWSHHPLRFSGPHNGGLDAHWHCGLACYAGCSAASIASLTNSLSQTTMAIFSVTSAELSPAAKKVVREKSTEKQLRERLHCNLVRQLLDYVLSGTAYQMDNRRPSLDTKHSNDVCPHQNGRS